MMGSFEGVCKEGMRNVGCGGRSENGSRNWMIWGLYIIGVPIIFEMYFSLDIDWWRFVPVLIGGI